MTFNHCLNSCRSTNPDRSVSRPRKIVRALPNLSSFEIILSARSLSKSTSYSPFDVGIMLSGFGSWCAIDCQFPSEYVECVFMRVVMDFKV